MTTALPLPPQADVRLQLPSGPATRPIRPKRIALLLADLRGGGVQKMTLALARGLAAEGHEVSLVVFAGNAEAQIEIPSDIGLQVLRRGSGASCRLLPLLAEPLALPQMLLPVVLAWKPMRGLNFLASLRDYLQENGPDALIAAAPNSNLVAIWARRLAGTNCRLLISERSAPSQMLTKSRKWRSRFLPGLMRHTYPQAEVIVSVSSGLGDDLAAVTGLPRDLIRTIYNPVVGDDLLQAAARPVEHPWFAAGEPPVVMAAGRLSPQKDYPTLVKAFAVVRERRRTRLVIFGSTTDPTKTEKRQAQLMGLARKLGVEADVALPGFTDNPFAYMARAGVFVLSSRYEGLPAVLIQAMACGCPVVSTDCPTGPREILDEGRCGPLVSVGDATGLGAAILGTLDEPLPKEALQRRSLQFASKRAVSEYLTALFPGQDPATAAAVEGDRMIALV